MPLDNLEQRLEAVAVQIETTRDLDGLRGAAAHTIGVGACMASRHNFCAGKMMQPGCEDGGFSIRQQVDDAQTLQIDEDRAIALAAPPSPVTNLKHARRSPRSVRQTAS